MGVLCERISTHWQIGNLVGWNGGGGGRVFKIVPILRWGVGKRGSVFYQDAAH